MAITIIAKDTTNTIKKPQSMRSHSFSYSSENSRKKRSLIHISKFQLVSWGAEPSRVMRRSGTSVKRYSTWMFTTGNINAFWIAFHGLVKQDETFQHLVFFAPRFITAPFTYPNSSSFHGRLTNIVDVLYSVDFKRKLFTIFW